jgi:hypothetical protein
MPRRISLIGILVAALTLIVTPAMAADPAPLPATFQLTVGGPTAPADRCDYTALFCGTVAVVADFSGLTGRARPESEDVRPQLSLSGTVRVTRTYGCATRGGHRVRFFDRRVTEDLTLNTRRGAPFRVPQTGDTVSATAYAFLADSQPHNCPFRTRPMTYKIVAGDAVLVLGSAWEPVPSASYPVTGRAVWEGAVPTPTTTPAR